MIIRSRFKRYYFTCCLSLLLFSIITSVEAQDTLLYSSSHGSFIVKYIKNAGTEEKNTSEIIETIAEDAIKPPSKTLITLDFQLQIQSVEKTPGVLSFFAVIHKPFLKGDCRFRKFDIRNVLWPDRFDMDIRIGKKSDSTS